MKELTERQQQVLNFIRSYTEENSCPPTVRETALYFSVSLKAIQDHFSALRKKGYLSHSEKRSRSIKVLINDDEQQKDKITEIPLLGIVAAGKPLLCEENFEGSISLPQSMIHGGGDYFALKVRGDSMIQAGILDGDIAVIRQQNVACNGDIVVALIDDSVTLKRFFKESSRIRLQPENASYNPIYSQDVHVLGILSNIIRNY
jgi:repressor LexA